MNNREHPLIAAIKRTLAAPGATRRMVLEQGKAFVYLSDDDQFLVTEWPDGRIEKKAVPTDEYKRGRWLS